jgi:uncharacterized delta-60 repeat protein
MNIFAFGLLLLSLLHPFASQAETCAVPQDAAKSADAVFINKLLTSGEDVSVVGSTLARGTAADFTLIKLDTEGNIEDGFPVYTNFSCDDALPSADGVEDAILDSQGRIIAIGQTSGAKGDDIALVRYLHDGTLDTSFGSEGKVQLDFGSRETSYKIAEDAQGRLLLVVLSDDRGMLVRLLENGTLDNTFGDGGRVSVDEARVLDNVAVQPDGKIVVAGDQRLLRYLGDGTLDMTFGEEGKLKLDLLLSEVQKLEIRLDEEARILVAGGGDKKLVVARFTSDGVLDPSFGQSGKTEFNFEQNVRLGSFLRLPNGKLALVGTEFDFNSDDYAPLLNDDPIVVLLSPDGTPDTGFGEMGVLKLPIDPSAWTEGAVIAGNELVLGIQVGVRSTSSVLKPDFIVFRVATE